MNIQFKLLTFEDVGNVFKAVDENREYLGQWLPWVEKTKNIYDTMEFIKSTEDEYSKGVGYHFNLLYNDVFVGLIAFHSIDGNSAEIGYWIVEKYSNKGIMTSACEKLIEMGFNKLNFENIIIGCAIGNNKSSRIAEKLKFNKIDKIKYNVYTIKDRKIDVEYYLLSKNRWSGFQ